MKNGLSTFLPEEAAAVLADAALRAAASGPLGSKRRNGVIDEAIAYVYAKWPAYFRPEARGEFNQKRNTSKQNGKD